MARRVADFSTSPEPFHALDSSMRQIDEQDEQVSSADDNFELAALETPRMWEPVTRRTTVITETFRYTPDAFGAGQYSYLPVDYNVQMFFA